MHRIIKVGEVYNKSCEAWSLVRYTHPVSKTRTKLGCWSDERRHPVRSLVAGQMYIRAVITCESKLTTS